MRKDSEISITIIGILGTLVGIVLLSIILTVQDAFRFQEHHIGINNEEQLIIRVYKRSKIPIKDCKVILNGQEYIIPSVPIKVPKPKVRLEPVDKEE